MSSSQDANLSERAQALAADTSWLDPVVSSSMRRIGYSRPDRMLFIEFNTGALYVYYDVGPSVWRAFEKAASHGQYFYNQIRDKYRYERL
jgi:hypothetical protein